MLIEIAKGLAFTLRTMMRRPITVQWPEEQRPTMARHRGRHILHRYDNGMEKCIGCELCAAACPVGCIYVGSAENDPAHPVSPGERFAARYEINLLRCIYCGYCAEACPTEAITLGPRYEMADYRREPAVATKEDLLEAWPKFAQPSASVSGAGPGSDQRDRVRGAPEVKASVAWDGAAETPSGIPHPDELGIPSHVPTITMPEETDAP